MTLTERRKIKRQLQYLGDEKYTHPKEKEEQIKKVLEDRDRSVPSKKERRIRWQNTI